MIPNENNCHRSRADVDNLLKEIVTTLENIPREYRTNTDYVERNVLNYGWLLQTFQGTIDTNLIEKLVGISLKQLTQKFIKTMVFGGYAVQLTTGMLGNRSGAANQTIKTIKFCQPLFEAIGDQLNSPNMYNNMTTPRKLLGELCGAEYLSLLIDPHNTNLITVTSNAIIDALGMHSTSRHLDEIPELADSHVLQSELANYSRIITYPSGWNFILLAYPSDEALNEATVNKITTFLHEARIRLFKKNRDQYFAIDSLLITPSIDGDIGGLSQDTAINYMWSFSALRFVTELEKLQSDFTGFEQAVAENFNSIFDPQKSSAFSVQEAIKNLRKNLPPSRSLCFTNYKSKHYILMIPQPQGTAWTFATPDIIKFNLEETPENINSSEHVCDISQSKFVCQVFNLVTASNPEDPKAKLKKVAWKLVGDAQGLTDDCDKEILAFAHQLWSTLKK